uniref:SLPTX10 n=1 Tax=Hemiscolopendra marginata TaxID=943146 RepID=A0A646QD99_9MYRI
MFKGVLISYSLLLLIYVFHISITLKVEDLEEPESYLKLVKKYQKNVSFLSYMKLNRKNCMPACNILKDKWCEQLSPECCPTRTKICLELDIVQEAIKKEEKEKKDKMEAMKKKMG